MAFNIVTSNFRTHVGDTTCLELFGLEDSLEAISTVVAPIRTIMNVQTVSDSVLPMDDGTILVD